MTSDPTTPTFPSFMVGSYSDVKRTSGKLVTAALRAASLEPLLALPHVSLSSGSLVVLDRRWSTIDSKAPHLHADLFWKTLEARIERRQLSYDRFLDFADQGLRYPWGFVGLLDSQRYRLVKSKPQMRRFVECAAVNWPALLSLGPCFTTGHNAGMELSECPTLLSYCLANLGIKGKDVLPLTATRFDAFLTQLGFAPEAP